MLEKQFIQDYFNADFRGIDSLLNDVLVPIFGSFDPGYDEITLSRDAKEKAAQSRIKKIKHVATLPAMGMDIKVFDVTLDSRCHIHRARKGIQMLIRQYVEKFEGAFIVFHYEDPANRSWRFSYLEKRESNVASTNAKRYTYLCGQQYPCRTLAERFEGLQKQDLTAINLEKAFSVETLSDEFFNEYRNFYQDLVNFVKYEDNLIDGFVEYAKGDKELAEKYARDYIKKLMGRLVFIQFLQNKAWLKEDIHYTHSLFDSCSEKQKENFLDNVLEPLFFGVFNTPKDAREVLFHQEHWDMNLYNEWKDFPYLNGGLFECDELDKLSLPLPSYFFSNPGKEDKVRKPNDEYYSDACGIFDFFDRYNFTIDESDPLDREIGVDPEMLGKIFENLLEDNKDKGAFYTPKEIVDYMCKEALTAYLIDEARKKSEVNKQRQENFEDAIRAFVNDPEMTVKRIQQYDDKQLIDLDESLRDVKICDPAIGSGAFPMGLLNLLMACRTAVNDALRKGEPRYLLKKEIIQNNIYGVDIEKGAIDIARLRFWLSIVVDLEEPEALPNFDYKFMQGNSLMEQFEGRDLSNMFETTIDTGKKGGKDTPLIIFDEESTQRAILSEKLTKYFASSTGVDKHKLRNEVNTAVRNLIAEKVSGNQEFISELDAIDISANDKFFLWHTWFADVFNRPSKQGFDIVIGNPPYIKEYTNKSAFDGFRETSPYYMGKMDLWYGFACHGIDLLCEHGVLCFIAQNNWTTSAGAKKMRKKVIEDSQILQLLDFNTYMVFENADIQTMIMLFEHDTQKEEYQFDYRTITSGNEKKDMLALLTKQDRNTKYLTPKINRQKLSNSLLTFSDDDAIFDKIAEGKTHLKDDEVAQGIVFPQDFLDKKGAKKLNNRYPVGSGIFGLSNYEYQAMHLSELEKKLIKPYFTTEQIGRYYTQPTNKQWLIYTDSSYKKTNSLDNFPNIKSHLDQFIDIFTSDNKPYGLHRCRKEIFFNGEKIISLRKCVEKPCFSYSDFDCYVTQTFFSIKTSRWNMKFLTGLLNSKLVAFWLRNKGKMQGSNYQVDKEPLQNIPLPLVDIAQQQPIIDLVDSILVKKKQNPQTDTSVEEKAIDQLVYQLYGLSKEEINLIEKG